MVRIQFSIADEDRARFIKQARLEGMTLSAWLRAAAMAHLEYRKRTMSRKSLIQVYKQLVPEAEQVDPLNSPIPLGPFFERLDPAKQSESKEDIDGYLKARLLERGHTYPPKTEKDIRAFFKEIDALDIAGVEPEWEDHLRVLDESIREGLPDV